MRRLSYFAMVLTILTVLMVAGCSDRGTNMPTPPVTYGNTWIPQEIYAFYPYLAFQRDNPDGIAKLAMWYPRDIFGTNAPLSLLVLLAPEDADEWFYFERGLHKVCNELYAAKKIPPMMVACVGNSTRFGGYFYGNSVPGGQYDSVIADALIDKLRFKYPSLINNVRNRGIGGFGQGAYGALRAAIKHPGVFGSISAVDGPLDFDGANGTSGLLALMDDAIAEIGGNQIDPALSKPVSRMFVGGSLAFSPHDTLLVYHGPRNYDDIGNPFYIDARYSINDSATLVTYLTDGAVGSPSQSIKKSEAIQFAFHLPFDETGTRYPLIWNLWLTNNLPTMLAAGGNTALQDAAVWIASSPEAHLGYHEQTESFKNYLDGRVSHLEYKTYTGYAGNPAHGSEYVYNLLAEIIQFHGDHFRGLHDNH